MAFGFFKKLVEKITGKKPAPQKKDGRPQQGKQGGDAKGKGGNGRGRHGRRGRHGNGGEQQPQQQKKQGPQDQQRKQRNEQQRNALAENGNDFVTSRYSWETAGEKLEEVLRNVVLAGPSKVAYERNNRE